MRGWWSTLPISESTTSDGDHGSLHACQCPSLHGHFRASSTLPSKACLSGTHTLCRVFQCYKGWPHSGKQMPEARVGHAALPLQPSQPSEMDASRGPGPSRLLEEPAPRTLQSQSKLFHTDDGAVAIHTPVRDPKRLDKRSWDYIMRSGVAGGLAGCAVSITPCQWEETTADRVQRQRQWSDLSTESRSCFKLRTRISQSILAAGSVSSAQCEISIRQMESEACFAVIPPRCYESFPMLA